MQVGLNLKGDYYLRKILSHIFLKIPYLPEGQLYFSEDPPKSPNTNDTQPPTLTLKESN